MKEPWRSPGIISSVLYHSGERDGEREVGGGKRFALLKMKAD